MGGFDFRAPHRADLGFIFADAEKRLYRLQRRERLPDPAVACPRTLRRNFLSTVDGAESRLQPIAEFPPPARFPLFSHHAPAAVQSRTCDGSGREFAHSAGLGVRPDFAAVDRDAAVPQ